MGAIKGLRLDKGIPMPLYEQLRQGLLTAIMDGSLPAGAKMPTEEELCAAYGISRPVVRQAYNALIESGAGCRNICSCIQQPRTLYRQAVQF